MLGGGLVPRGQLAQCSSDPASGRCGGARPHVTWNEAGRHGWGWVRAAVLMDDEHMRGRVTKGWMDGEIATRGKASTLAGTPIGAMTIVWCRSMWIVRIHGAVPRQSCPAIGRELPGTAGAPCRRASATEQVGPRQPPRTSLWVCTSRIHREGRLVHPRNDGRPARRSRVNLLDVKPPADMEHEPEPRARLDRKPKGRCNSLMPVLLLVFEVPAGSGARLPSHLPPQPPRCWPS